MNKVAALIALALASVALVACGGGDDDTTTTQGAEQGATAGGSGSGGSTLSFEADPGGGLTFTTDTMKAKAGRVTIAFENPAALTHDVAIEDSSGETLAETEQIAEGSDSTTADLKPGEYTFYCSVPGHREAGMEGTLTVE